MKKILAVLLSLIMIFTFAACDSNDGGEAELHQNADGTVTYVGFEKAGKIAVQSLGMGKEGKHVDPQVEFDEEDEIYEVFLHVGKMDHDFEIDAVTGEILEHEVEVNFGY